jgi:hypothetical protein
LYLVLFGFVADVTVSFSSLITSLYTKIGRVPPFPKQPRNWTLTTVQESLPYGSKSLVHSVSLLGQEFRLVDAETHDSSALIRK